MDENFLDEAMECYKDGVDRRMSIVAANVPAWTCLVSKRQAEGPVEEGASVMVGLLSFRGGRRRGPGRVRARLSVVTPGAASSAWWVDEGMRTGPLLRARQWRIRRGCSRNMPHSNHEAGRWRKRRPNCGPAARGGSTSGPASWGRPEPRSGRG